MLRAVSIFLAFQAALVLSTSPDDVELLVAQHDDECLASDPGSCALSALQKRGAKVAAAAAVAEREEDALSGLEEIEPLDGGDEAEESGSLGVAAARGPDISPRVEAHDSQELKRQAMQIGAVSKYLATVEASVNETYTLVMEELSPDKDSRPPPMPKAHASSSRRRRHAMAVHLAPREKKISGMIGKCDGVMNSVWARVKRCSDMLVYSEKRINGGELEASPEESVEAEADDDAEPEDEGEEEDDEPSASEDGTVSVQSASGDLKVRIKQLNKEIYDVTRDVKGLGKRAVALRKLYNKTYAMA